MAHAIHAWLVAIEPDANALYCTATERFLRLANAHISRVAADAGSLEIEDLPSELGFHARRQFYFTNLMHAAAGSPVTWAIDRLAPRSVRQEHISRASAAYLAHLLDGNSHRVENDFRDRTRESRRWLEAQIRKGLVNALRSAERALSIAVESQHMSEAQVCHRRDHLASLRAELVALVSFAS